MTFLAVLLVLALQGLFVGAFARLALPGPDPLTLLQTMGVGLAGSFLAGLVVYLARRLRRDALAARRARVLRRDPLRDPAPARRRADRAGRAGREERRRRGY